MHNKNFSKNIILTAFFTFLLVFTSSSNIFAKSQLTASGDLINARVNIANPANEKKPCKKMHESRRKFFEIVLKDSVNSKIITQDEYKKIISFMDERHKDNQKKKYKLFEDLVDNKIITQEKADKLKQEFFSKNNNNNTNSNTNKNRNNE